MRTVIVLAAAAALAGCVTQPQGQWVRMDGKSVASSPQLMQQAKIDKNYCVAEALKAGASVSMPGAGYGYYYAASEKNTVRDAAALACMNAKGYDFKTVKPGQTIEQVNVDTGESSTTVVQ